jgi:hypothetical protein
MKVEGLSVVLLAVAVIVSSASLAQQATTARVAIGVTDPTGAALAHVQVRVVPAPDPARKMETDEKGQVSLDLKPGGYAVFVRAPAGFKGFSTHIDVREMKEVQTVPIVLQLAPTSSPTIVTPIETRGEHTLASSKADLMLFAYPYHDPTGFSFADLKSMPHITVTFHNTHTNADETYSGVRLADLLGKLGAPLGSELRGESLTNYIVATGSDGYQAVLALAEVDPSFHPGEVLVADTMNGKPLDEHSGPLKLVVTEDKRPARSVRNLVSIELKSAQ